MYSNNFEEAFSKFLESQEYDEAEYYLFSMMRRAFAAGWLAAAGEPPSKARIFQLILPTTKEEK